MARTGSQWRHLPDEYGKWNSVFRRFRRRIEIGVFEALIESLSERVERDRSADMVDFTVIRADHCAIGINRGLKIKKLSLMMLGADHLGPRFHTITLRDSHPLRYRASGRPITASRAVQPSTPTFRMVI